MIDKLNKSHYEYISNSLNIPIENINTMQESGLIKVKELIKFLIVQEYKDRYKIICTEGAEADGNTKLLNVVYDLAQKYDCSHDVVYKYIYNK